MYEYKTMARDNGKYNRIVVFLGVILTLTYLWISAGMPLQAMGYNVHDDFLLTAQAESITQGEWLGEYNDKTLIKGTTFSIFLAICSFLNIPYQVGVSLLYVMAVLLFIYSIKDIVKNNIYLFLMYVFMLFSPVMFNAGYVQRSYRMSIIPSEIIIIISLFIILYLKNNMSNKKRYVYSIALGIAITAFWQTREDSMWLLPFILVATICIFVKQWISRESNRDFCCKGISTILPIVILSGGLIFTSIINYLHYGIYTTSELNNSYFSDMMVSMYSIEQDEDIPYVFVNKKTIEELYEVSPTFGKIKEEMEGMYQGFWQTHGVNSTDGEIEKDYIMWAIRDAVAQAGYYKDANIANEFYQQVHNEIEQAFKNGILKKEKGLSISSLSRPLEVELINPLFNKFIESIEWILDYEKIHAEIIESTGPLENIRLIENMTRANIIYPNNQVIEAGGWIFAKNDEDVLTITIVDDKREVIVGMNSSGDVYEHFKKEGVDYQNSKMARFVIEEQNMENASLNIYINGILEDTIVLDQANKSKDTETYQVNFDYYSEKGDQKYIEDCGSFEVNQANKIIGIYQKTGNVTAILSILGYIYILYLAIKSKKFGVLFDIGLILTGIMLSFCILVGGVSFAYLEAWNSEYRNLYLAGAYPLMNMFSVISISVSITYILKRRDSKKGRS